MRANRSGTIFIGARFVLGLGTLVAMLAAASPAAAGDFDGDGRSDILWYGEGAAPDRVTYGKKSGFSSRPVSVRGRYEPVQGDFDGDGRSDILWYGEGAAPDRVTYGKKSGFSSRRVSVRGRYEPVEGDFDGDGRSDILWYGEGAAPDFMSYGKKSGFSSRRVSVRGVYEPVEGDFDGDGRSDILWYGEGAAPDFMSYGKKSGFSSRRVSVRGVYEPVEGDFDGDGRSDILRYGEGAAPDFMSYGKESGFSSRRISVDGWFDPVTGDFNGDGQSDILWYGPGDAADFLWRGRPARRFVSSNVPIDGRYIATVGDFDGDSRSDIAWYAPGTGRDHVWYGRNSGFARRQRTVDGRYDVVVGDTTTSVDVTSPLTRTYATLPGLDLHLPTIRTRYVGFHQSGSGTAMNSHPLTSGVPWVTLPSRHRGTGASTGADLVQPSGEEILSPVSGTVVSAHLYRLYCRYDDEMVAIAPDGHSGEVLLLHLAGLLVRPGDRVLAGRTPIAGSARRLPFASQVDRFSGHPGDPHVHIEARSNRRYRSPGGAC